MKFDYFFRENPEALNELNTLGIKFISVDTGDDFWPGLKLPSGTVIAIARDDEGNGPGALHVFPLSDLEPAA